MSTSAQQKMIEQAVATAVALMVPSIVEQVVLALSGAEQAALPPVVTPPVAANGKPVVFRSAPGKAAAKAACEALSVKYDLKVVGGSRTFKSLSAKEQAAYRAESKAIWAAVPVTRTTKA